MIQLDRVKIDNALPLVTEGLEKYYAIQKKLPTIKVDGDRDFQKTFNGYYRIRRGSAWQAIFYSLLEQQKSLALPFDQVLHKLYVATERIEASFASKLVASVDPHQPVIDSVVLENLGLRLLRIGSHEAKRARAIETHNQMRVLFAGYLATDDGAYLVNRFEQSFPGRQITHVKMLDFVLWKTR